MNTSDLLLRLRDDLREDSAGMWTDEKLIRYLDRSYRRVFAEQMQLFEDWLLTSLDVNIVADTELYDLAGYIKKIRMVEILYDGDYYRMSPVTVEEKAMYDNSVAAVISPQYTRYYIRGKQIGLVPVPADSVTSGLRITYTPVSGYLHKGTAQAGSTTSITLASGAASFDDAYNNMDIEIISGTGVGQKVTISDYTGSSRIAEATFTTAPDSTSEYALWPRTEQEFDEVIIQLAVAMALKREAPEESEKAEKDAMAFLQLIREEMGDRNREAKHIQLAPDIMGDFM